MRRALVALFVLCVGVGCPPPAGADNPTKEFIMACTYGVLAGTLVGAASLAFTKRPGDNLNKVARGASIGLYSGILLGVYVVYIVPGLEKTDDEDPVARAMRSPLQIGPLFAAAAADRRHLMDFNLGSSGGGGGVRLDGVQAQWKILRF